MHQGEGDHLEPTPADHLQPPSVNNLDGDHLYTQQASEHMLPSDSMAAGDNGFERGEQFICEYCDKNFSVRIPDTIRIKKQTPLISSHIRRKSENS